MTCELCGKVLSDVAENNEWVSIYSKPVCVECARRAGVQCEFCGEWGLKGDDEFPANEYGTMPIHRKCLDHKAAFDKRKR